MKLDSIDLKLIEFLQEDCKQTTKELAEKLGLSTTAVYERIKKLEKQEIISKYVAIVDRNKINRGFIVLSHVKIKSHSKDSIIHFENIVSEMPEVLEIFHVSGDYDYILKIGVKDMEAYREFMISKLTNLEEVQSTHSMFMIKEVKNSTAYNLL